jgi:hypothetical protein
MEASANYYNLPEAGPSQGNQSMKFRQIHILPAVIVLSAAFVAAPALAQQAQTGQASGTTSGPASGNNVEPSAVTQKKAGNADAGAVSAGAPGKAGVKGGESGQKPKR